MEPLLVIFILDELNIKIGFIHVSATESVILEKYIFKVFIVTKENVVNFINK